MANDFRVNNLSGLDEGLRVRHIANFPLIKCRADEDMEEVFRRPEYKEFDRLPITQGSRIIGIAERSDPKVRRPLDDLVLVAADNPLSHFIHTVHEQPYRLVVDGTAITGIVTWSDLLKLPVTVLAFALIAQLELTMNSRIKEEYGKGEDWFEFLGRGEKAKILGWRRKLEGENYHSLNSQVLRRLKNRMSLRTLGRLIERAGVCLYATLLLGVWRTLRA